MVHKEGIDYFIYKRELALIVTQQNFVCYSFRITLINVLTATAKEFDFSLKKHVKAN